MAYLIIGKSESGKSTLARKLASQGGKRVVVVNDTVSREEEGVEYWPWEKLETAHGVAIIIEDLVGTTERQFKQISHALNVKKHHGGCSLYIICHSLVKTNVTGLLTFFDFLIFTSARTNVANIKAACTFFKIPPSTREKHLTLFGKESKDPYAYYILDLKDFSFLKGGCVETSHPPGGRDTPTSAAAVASLADYRKSAEILFGQLPNSKRCLAIFEIILGRLDYLGDSISPSDLMIRLQTKDSQKEKRFSLVDYVFSLVELDPPASDIVRLHAFLKSKNIFYPRCLIKNKHFELYLAFRLRFGSV